LTGTGSLVIRHSVMAPISNVSSDMNTPFQCCDSTARNGHS
jgi:hypothetical protein